MRKKIGKMKILRTVVPNLKWSFTLDQNLPQPLLFLSFLLRFCIALFDTAIFKKMNILFEWIFWILKEWFNEKMNFQNVSNRATPYWITILWNHSSCNIRRAAAKNCRESMCGDLLQSHCFALCFDTFLPKNIWAVIRNAFHDCVSNWKFLAIEYIVYLLNWNESSSR